MKKSSNNKIRYTKLNRRGYDIVLPTEIYKMLNEQKINISLVINGNYKTVQCTKNNRYLGTLKQCMGVTGFKNGDSCDFHMSNLITKD